MIYNNELLEISEQITELVQIGTVTEVDKEGRSLVKVELADGFVSDMLPLMQLASPLCAVWVAPRVGEQVVLLSPEGQAGKGIAIRGIYHKSREEPAGKNKDNAIVEFSDGTTIIYDNAQHSLDINVNGGTVSIKATKDIIVEGKNVTVIAKEKGSKVVVDSSDITLGGTSTSPTAGVVTGECNCVMTGSAHVMFSSKVKAVK